MIMISESDSSFQNMLRNSQIFSLSTEDQLISPSLESTNHLSASNSDTHATSLLYNLSVLNDKLHQIQSFVDIFICDQNPPESSHPPSMAIAAMNSLIQEVIMTASSMLFTSQQMTLLANSSLNNAAVHDAPAPNRQTIDSWECDQNLTLVREGKDYRFMKSDNFSITSSSFKETQQQNLVDLIDQETRTEEMIQTQNRISSTASFDIVELDVSNLLAKYTHHCQVCGKGFKRDANLRMHMRAHGDEYKTSAALSNPMKSGEKDCNLSAMGRKYSCPQEGCRWNRKHAKFQPLKSLICVKNHYKRTHCPKIYVCKRCNRKQFSVLSDLRTHEKHCGNVTWVCSCGTTFSRKDKLMGHVALFVGHSPAINSATSPGNGSFVCNRVS